MGLFNPSVLKEYRKRAEAATKLTKLKNDTLIAKLELCVPIIDNYKKARIVYQGLLTNFGLPRYQEIVDHKGAPPTQAEQQAFRAIIDAGGRVELLGDQVTPADSTLVRAHRELNEAVTAEKAAYAQVSKYLQDKEVMKGLGPEAYKKWKKELRADLF